MALARTAIAVAIAVQGAADLAARVAETTGSTVKPEFLLRSKWINAPTSRTRSILGTSIRILLPPRSSAYTSYVTQMPSRGPDLPALTEAAEIRLTDKGLPNTFVPGRNLLFFTYAAAIAYRRNLQVLVGGMCETDYSGYPDCRDDTLKAMQIALSLGMDQRFTIETPLMWLDKAQTWQLSHELGGEDLVDLIRTETHTCYLGDRSTQHDWGVGCGQCPACELRAVGWAKWKRGPR